MRFEAQNREIGENITRLQREHCMKGITREELDKEGGRPNGEVPQARRGRARAAV